MTSPKPLAGRKVLIVDDEELVRLLLREELESQGAEITEAASGRLAFEEFAKTAFDAVITDVRMPDGDGLVLLSSIRADGPASRKDVAVVLLTAFSDPTVRRAAEQAHAIVVAKPYLLDNLVERLVSLLARP